MKVYILVGVFLAIGIYLLVQRVRCNIAVKDDVSGGEVAEEVKSWVLDKLTRSK